MTAPVDINEKRKFTRRPLHQVVSFSLVESRESNVWYIGWIENVSVAGMKILINQEGCVCPGNRIMILCLPGGGHGMQTQEPVRIEAEVIWQSRDGLEFGLRYC